MSNREDAPFRRAHRARSLLSEAPPQRGSSAWRADKSACLYRGDHLCPDRHPVAARSRLRRNRRAGRGSEVVSQCCRLCWPLPPGIPRRDRVTGLIAAPTRRRSPLRVHPGPEQQGRAATRRARGVEKGGSIGRIAPATMPDYTSSPPSVAASNNRPNTAAMGTWRKSTIAPISSDWARPRATVILELTIIEASRVNVGNMGTPEIVIVPGEETGLPTSPSDPQLRKWIGRTSHRRVEQFRARAGMPRLERVYEDVAHPHDTISLPSGSR